MSQINLNPAAHIAPEVLPAPATSGMSAVAKIVIGVAALFFAIFVYVALSGSKGSGGMPPAQRKDELSEEHQAEAEKIRQILLQSLDGGVSAEYRIPADLQHIYRKLSHYSRRYRSC